MKTKISNCSSIGKFMILVGIMVGIPMLVILFYPTEVVYICNFISPSMSSVFVGLLMCIFAKIGGQRF